MTETLFPAPTRDVTPSTSWHWSLVAAGGVVAYATLAPALAPEAWHGVDLAAARQAPSVAHWFGTDSAGRDLFVRVALGLRISLLVAVVCSLVSTVLGVAVGTVAAAAGGLVDGILLRLTDATNALPHLLLGIVIVAFFPGALLAVVASIALTHWPPVARIVRSVAMGTRRTEYVEAAYLAGASRRAVVTQHLVPATLPQAAVSVVLLLPHAVWHESTLSFLGLGLPPDRASLGTLLAVSRGEVLIGGWWTLVFPAAALVLTTLATSGIAVQLRRRWSPLPEERLG